MPEGLLCFQFFRLEGPGKLDPKTKEVIALAVSAPNKCEYCINALTATLRWI